MHTLASSTLRMAAIVLPAMVIGLPAVAKAAPITVSGTLPPEYALGNPYGCAPTATAEALAYLDLRDNMPNMFLAKGTALNASVNVVDQISSPAHNAKYGVTDIDNPSLPVPAETSIADFLSTGVDIATTTVIGDTPIANDVPGIIGYATYRGYVLQATMWQITSATNNNLHRKSLADSWTFFTSEIDANRPMLLYVDSDGDGIADHLLLAFGYDSNYQGSGQDYYECYLNDGQTHGPVWEKFQRPSSTYSYGILDEMQIIPPAPTPEPGTLALLSLGIMPLLLRRKRA